MGVLVANSDSATTPAVTPVTIAVLTNDTLDGAPVVIGNLSSLPETLTAPAHGAVTWTAAGEAVYTPDPGFCGVDSFVYGLTEGATNRITPDGDDRITPSGDKRIV